MNRKRIGVIGAGWMGRRHVRGLGAVSQAELVAICDSDRERAARLAQDEGVADYVDWRDMLSREELDAVLVCVPPAAHCEPVVAALEAGLDVFLEKPIALEPTDGEAIVEASEATDRVVAVGYQWREIALLDSLRAELENAEVGFLFSVSFGPTVARPWFLEHATGGGNLLERGSHHVDLQRLIGGRVVEVYAAEGEVLLAQSEMQRTGDIADVVSVVLRFETGALGAIHVAWTQERAPESHSLTTLGRNVTLELRLHPEIRLTGRAHDREVSLRSDADPYERTLARFFEAVQERNPELVSCKPKDALETLRVCRLADEAIAAGCSVTVGSYEAG